MSGGNPRSRRGARAAQDGAYWASWALTHYGTLFLSCALCTAVGTYPFPRTPPLVMATLLWLAAAALLAFAYFLSTLFSKSRVAGLATALLYALAMVPGCAALGSGRTMWASSPTAPFLVVAMQPWLAATPMLTPSRLLSARSS